MGKHLNIFIKYECSCGDVIYNQSRSNNFLSRHFRENYSDYEQQDLKDIFDRIIVEKNEESEEDYYSAIFCVTKLILCDTNHRIAYH